MMKWLGFFLNTNNLKGDMTTDSKTKANKLFDEKLGSAPIDYNPTIKFRKYKPGEAIEIDQDYFDTYIEGYQKGFFAGVCAGVANNMMDVTTKE